MSWRASSWAVEQHAGSPAAKAILLVLAEASSDDGFTFIGHAEIAARTELGKRTVIAQIAQLERVGLIRRERRFNPADGSRTSNAVFLALVQSADAAPREAVQGAADAPRPPSKVQLDDRLSATDVPPRCISRTLTYLEPVNNLSGEQKPARRKRETALPEGFPSKADIEAAALTLRSAGLNLDANLQALSFRDHALANDRRVRNWPAAFRMWITKAIGFAGPKDKLAVPVAEAAQVSPDQVWRSRLTGYKTSKFWNTTDWGPRPDKPGCNAPVGLMAEFGMVDDIIPLHQRKTGAA